MRILSSLNLLLLSICLPCVAQTHFCIAGDLDHLTATEVSACKAKMTQVRETIQHRGAPSGWHFVVVCDESGWSDLASFSGKEGAKLRNADFNTDRELHWTFLRGSRMDAENRDAAGTMLAAALSHVPGRTAEPGFENGAHPMPNPQRVIHQPSLEMAEAHDPSADVTAGQ
ncbi:MAG: hypothetical protein ACRYGF_08540 [Janthinobacterium lividum]